jgi:hypothetical protein
MRRSPHDRAVDALLIDVCRNETPSHPQSEGIAGEVVRAA